MYLHFHTVRRGTVLLRRLDKNALGIAICSCNDGLRPVIFKIEATGEESRLDYNPVVRE